MYVLHNIKNRIAYTFHNIIHCLKLTYFTYRNISRDILFSLDTASHIIFKGRNVEFNLTDKIIYKQTRVTSLVET